MCHCGKHCHIILSDGSQSAEFAFVVHGRSMIMVGVLEGRLTDEEGHALIAEIVYGTTLPTLPDEVDLDLLWRIECLNQLRSAAQPEAEVIPSDMHAWLSQPVALPPPPNLVAYLKRRTSASKHLRQ